MTKFKITDEILERAAQAYLSADFNGACHMDSLRAALESVANEIFIAGMKRAAEIADEEGGSFVIGPILAEAEALEKEGK